jgi:diguanylate cyclase (GGDEF)-like protein
MDITTLRIAFTVVACVLLVLFYFGAYRTTRAPFSGWWTLSLLFFGAATICYLANGTGLEVVANPLGNGFGVLGAEAAWCAARSLTAPPIPWRRLAIAPVIAIVAGLLGDSAHDRWSGGAVFLALMTGVLAATTWSLHRAAAPELGPRRLPTPIILVRALGTISAILSVFYGMRTVVFVVAGPHSAVFERWFDTAPTTLLLLVQLVVVSFSMSSLSTVQQLDDLHQRAVYDRLTGLMRPEEFRDQAADMLPQMAHSGEVVMLAMADLDHFKRINDDLGHAVGDEVLRAFGWSARTALGPRALCGRLGGEEFGLLFPAADFEHAERLLDTMSVELHLTAALPDGRIPTVSIGLVQVDPRAPLNTQLQRADRALYEAKAQGRDRIVRA